MGIELIGGLIAFTILGVAFVGDNSDHKGLLHLIAGNNTGLGSHGNRL
jgi:hypothetical protein